MAYNMKGYYAKRGLKPGRNQSMAMMESINEGQEAQYGGQPLGRTQSTPALRNTMSSLRSGTPPSLSKAGLLALSSASTAASSTGSLCSRCQCCAGGSHAGSHRPGSAGGHSNASHMSRLSKGSRASEVVRMFDAGSERPPRTPASSIAGTSISRTSTQLRSEVEAMVQEEMAKVVNPLKEQLAKEAAARGKAEERLNTLEGANTKGSEGQ